MRPESRPEAETGHASSTGLRRENLPADNILGARIRHRESWGGELPALVREMIEGRVYKAVGLVLMDRWVVAVRAEE